MPRARRRESEARSLARSSRRAAPRERAHRGQARAHLSRARRAHVHARSRFAAADRPRSREPRRGRSPRVRGLPRPRTPPALEQTARAVTGVHAEDGGSFEELPGRRVPGTAASLPRGRLEPLGECLIRRERGIGEMQRGAIGCSCAASARCAARRSLAAAVWYAAARSSGCRNDRMPSRHETISPRSPSSSAASPSPRSTSAATITPRFRLLDAAATASACRPSR